MGNDNGECRVENEKMEDAMEQTKAIELTKEFYGKLRQVRDGFYVSVSPLKQVGLDVKGETSGEPLYCWSGTEPNCIMTVIEGDTVQARIETCVDQAAKAAFIVAMMHLEDYAKGLLSSKENEDCGFSQKKRFRKIGEHYGFTEQLARVDHLRLLRNAVTHGDGRLPETEDEINLLSETKLLAPDESKNLFLPASNKDGRFVRPGEKFMLKISNVEGILLCLCEFGAALLGNNPWDVPDWALYALWMRGKRRGKYWPSEDSYERAQELANRLVSVPRWLPGKPPQFDE